MSEVHKRVQEQFSKTAHNYVTSGIHASGADLQWILDLLGDIQGLQALDIATGGGHTAALLAEAGAQVTASDLTPEMLAEAEAHLMQRGLEVEFVQAAAEALPFPAGQFELVTCRIAMHHFESAGEFFAEAARVLAPGGRLVLVDNTAPEDEALDQLLNTIERWRDPSHVRAYPLSEWVGLAAAAGLDLLALRRWWRQKELAGWFERAQTSNSMAERVVDRLARLDKPSRTYFGVQFANELESPGSADDEGETSDRPRAFRHETALALFRAPLA